MRPTEAVILCRVVKAYCPQQAIDEFTADAYGELLADYTLADARAAATNLGRSQPFISPAEIGNEIRRIRAKRIADYGPIEPPADLDPDDTRGYQRWLAETTKRIADGDLEPQPAIHLGATHDVVGELGQIGRQVPRA